MTRSQETTDQSGFSSGPFPLGTAMTIYFRFAAISSSQPSPGARRFAEQCARSREEPICALRTEPGIDDDLDVDAYICILSLGQRSIEFARGSILLPCTSPHSP